MHEKGTPSESSPTIEVRCDAPGVVLSVDGRLDERSTDLLTEAVNAALVAVRRASRIHVDLSRTRPGSVPLPRMLRRLEQAGATVTRPRTDAAPASRGAP